MSGSWGAETQSEVSAPLHYKTEEVPFCRYWSSSELDVVRGFINGLKRRRKRDHSWLTKEKKRFMEYTYMGLYTLSEFPVSKARKADKL